jgi:TonB family protein
MKGEVHLRIQVDEKGKVDQTTIMKGLDPALDRSAADAAKKYRFKPATKAGVPTSVPLFVSTSFECQ